MSASRPPLACDGVDVGIAGRTLVRGLSVLLRPGSLTALLGRNGAGKTLTLHTLCGIRSPARGEVRLHGRPFAELKRSHIARHIGLLPQITEDPFPTTVMEAVLVGRHPHIGFWDWETQTDRQIAWQAMRDLQLDELADRQVSTLSGGERRRVAVASLLTQDPEVYLLDEPVNHLDPHHQLDVLRLMRSKADQGHTILMSLHDAGLAARFADEVILLFGNGDWHAGHTEQALTEQTVSKLYGVSAREVRWESGRVFVTQ